MCAHEAYTCTHTFCQERTHLRLVCLRVCMDFYNFVGSSLVFMKLAFKFHKDQSLHCRYICETILMFVYFLSFFVFWIFSKFKHQSSPKIWKIHKTPWDIRRHDFNMFQHHWKKIHLSKLLVLAWVWSSNCWSIIIEHPVVFV